MYDDWQLSMIVGLGEPDYEQSLGWNRVQQTVQNMFLEAKMVAILTTAYVPQVPLPSLLLVCLHAAIIQKGTGHCSTKVYICIQQDDRNYAVHTPTSQEKVNFNAARAQAQPSGATSNPKGPSFQPDSPFPGRT